jgi:tetratricopeptide (TPR) repeat protein
MFVLYAILRTSPIAVRVMKNRGLQVRVPTGLGGLPVGIHLGKAGADGGQKPVVEQSFGLPGGEAVQFAQLVGLLIRPGLNPDDNFVVPGVETDFQPGINHIFQITHWRMTVTDENIPMNKTKKKTNPGQSLPARPSGQARWSVCFVLAGLLTFFSCGDQKQGEAAQFFLKGNLQLQKGEHALAIRYYSEAINKRPDFADAYNNRGLARMRAGDRENALADFSNAIARDSAFGAAFLNRADLLLTTGDPGAALADLQHIGPQYRDSTFYQTRLGDTFARLGRPADALPAYARALQLDPRRVDALVNRAALYYGQRQDGPARRDLDAALRLNPNQPDALTNLALLLARQGKPAEALPYADRALSQRPTEPVYQNNKAYVLLLLNRDAEALPLLRQSLRTDDQNAWTHRNLALYYRHQNQPEQARAELEQARKLDPTIAL